MAGLIPTWSASADERVGTGQGPGGAVGCPRVPRPDRTAFGWIPAALEAIQAREDRLRQQRSGASGENGGGGQRRHRESPRAGAPSSTGGHRASAARQQPDIHRGARPPRPLRRTGPLRHPGDGHRQPRGRRRRSGQADVGQGATAVAQRLSPGRDARIGGPATTWRCSSA